MRVIGTDKNGDEIAEVSVTELDTMFKEIRAKAIDEFAKKLKLELDKRFSFGINNKFKLFNVIDEIAEQMKAGGENE